MHTALVMQEGFFGMLPVSKAKFGSLQKFGMGWSRKLKFAGATCNGLVMKGKTSVVGDALEKQLFRAVEAQYVVSLIASCQYQRAFHVAYMHLEKRLLKEKRACTSLLWESV